jgi:hypothetical protein
MPITAASMKGTASCAANLSDRLRPPFLPGSPRKLGKRRAGVA